MNESAQFPGYVTKVFGFGRMARSVCCRRPYPTILTRCLFLSLFLGVVIRAGSYLDISKQTKRRRWQHLIHWSQRISDDAFYYVSERFYLEDLRQSLAEVNKTLKANKALESCKINGLLFLSLDANEHFHSRSRCCPCCCQREIQETGPEGQKQMVIEHQQKSRNSIPAFLPHSTLRTTLNLHLMPRRRFAPVSHTRSDYCVFASSTQTT
jgi:hypothetical protein